MGVHIEKVLEELGWSDGFHIPVANEENRRLEIELEEKIKKKNDLDGKVQALNDRVDSLEKHMKNVQQEHQQNQGLLNAHRSQLDSELRMLHTAEGETSRLEQDKARMDKDMGDLMKRHAFIEKEIQLNKDKLEKLKATVKWDKEALTEWDEELTRGEEGNELIRRYITEDERESNELEVQRQRLRMEVEERKRLVDAIVGEVTTLECTLERSAQLFRQLHRQRRLLVQQWENSVRELHNRDTDIQRSLEKIAEERERARLRAEELAETRRFLENEQNNNQELEQKIATTSRASHVLHDEIDKQNKALDDMNQLVQTIQRNMRILEGRLDHQRRVNNQLQKDIKNKSSRVEELKETVSTLESRIETINDKCQTSQARVKDIEDMVEAEEKYLVVLAKDVDKANKLKMQELDKVYELKKQEELQELEVQAITNSKTNLKGHLVKIEKEILRQQEVLYNLDFEATRLESRISTTTGEYEVENKEELENKIKDLESSLQEKVAIHNLLTNQVKQLEDTMRHLTADIGLDTGELTRLESQKQDLVLLIEGGEKKLAFSIRNYQQKQVEENILLLRVKKAEEALTKVGDAVYTLERQHLELESAMKERRVEINLHNDMIMIKKRTLTEENTKLRQEIQQRHIRTEQILKKHELAENSLGHDKDGEYLSIEAVKIQIAQEKILLQEQGDELDAKIRKTEKEIQALENTLKVVNASNDAYRRNLSVVDEDGPEYQEKKNLEEEYGICLDRMRESRAHLKEQEAELEAMEKTYSELMEAEEEIKCIFKVKEKQVSDLEKELNEQERKIDRANKQVKQLTWEIHGKRKTKEKSHEEKDIDVREMMEQNKLVLQQLLDMTIRFPETAPVIKRYLKEKGLELPTETITSLASARIHLKTTSSGSSRSSMASTSLHDHEDRVKTVCVSQAPSVITLELDGPPHAPRTHSVYSTPSNTSGSSISYSYLSSASSTTRSNASSNSSDSTKKKKK